MILMMMVMMNMMMHMSMMMMTNMMTHNLRLMMMNIIRSKQLLGPPSVQRPECAPRRSAVEVRQ